MSVCTFFGHRDCPSSIKPKLKQALVYLIETQSVDTFYVGTHGAFDAMVRSSLAELMQDYPHIRCTVVLAYLPTKKLAYPFPSLLPDGIEAAPKRFAISYRNKWMLKQSHFVVTYITHDWGGAAQFASLAKKQKKQSSISPNKKERCPSPREKHRSLFYSCKPVFSAYSLKSAFHSALIAASSLWSGKAYCASSQAPSQRESLIVPVRFMCP